MTERSNSLVTQDASTTRVWSSIDIWHDGKYSDCFRVPNSTNTSAYGWIPIPFVSIKNGKGPCALLVAGNHGDEYEGQIALRQLANSINKDDVIGHILILPALNFAAVVAGQRTSPLDDGNLNRLFPGRANGTITEMIAHFVAADLLPHADFVIDLHSGGRSLEFLPCALAKWPEHHSEVHLKSLDLLEAFGAPISYLTSGKGGGGQTTLAATADMLGVPAIMTELGGGERLSTSGLELAKNGVLRILQSQGLLSGDCPPAAQTRFMHVIGRQDYVYAHSNGLFEPVVELGTSVNAGDKAAFIYSHEDLEAEPRVVYFESSGVVVCQRAQTRTEVGDCLFHLLSDTEDPRKKQFKRVSDERPLRKDGTLNWNI